MGYAFFSVSQNDTLIYDTGKSLRPARLVWYARSGEQTPVDDQTAPYMNLRLSPDGRRAAVVIFADHGDGEIWITDLDRNVRTRATRLNASEMTPVWGAGGDRLYFGSQVTGSLDLYSVAADGSGEQREVLLDESDKYLLDVSRDGRYVAYWPIASDNPTADVWIHDTRTEPAVSAAGR